MIISSISSPIGGGERSASSILLRCIPVIDVLTRPCSFLCPALSCRFDFSPSLDRLQKTWQDLVSVRWWYDWVLSTDRMESTNLSGRPNLVQQKSIFLFYFFWLVCQTGPYVLWDFISSAAFYFIAHKTKPKKKQTASDEPGITSSSCSSLNAIAAAVYLCWETASKL